MGLPMRLAEWMTDPRPTDRDAAVLVGRVWNPQVAGPSVVAVRGEQVFDITADAPTMHDLCEAGDPVAVARSTKGISLGALTEILANTPRASRDSSRPWLL